MIAGIAQSRITGIFLSSVSTEEQQGGLPDVPAIGITSQRRGRGHNPLSSGWSRGTNGHTPRSTGRGGEARSVAGAFEAGVLGMEIEQRNKIALPARIQPIHDDGYLVKILRHCRHAFHMLASLP